MTEARMEGGWEGWMGKGTVLAVSEGDRLVMDLGCTQLTSLFMDSVLTCTCHPQNQYSQHHRHLWMRVEQQKV